MTGLKAGLVCLVVVTASLAGWSQETANRGGGPSKEILIESLALDSGIEPSKIQGLMPQLESELAMRKYLSGKAIQEGLDKQELVAASLILARQQALSHAYLNKIEASIVLSESDLISDYESAFPKKNKAKIKFAIFAKPEKARAALASLNQGKISIEDLALKADDKLVAQKKGDFGWIDYDAMPEQVVKTLNANKAKRPASPIKTAYGYVIYEWEESKLDRDKSYAEAKPALELQRKQMMMRAELAKIKKEALSSSPG